MGAHVGTVGEDRFSLRPGKMEKQRAPCDVRLNRPNSLSFTGGVRISAASPKTAGALWDSIYILMFRYVLEI